MAPSKCHRRICGGTRGGEGGITRRSAPRPFGAALRALSPLRRCHSNLNGNDENLVAVWRRRRDCSRLRRSSLADAQHRRRLKLRRHAPPLRRRLVEPKGSNPARASTKQKLQKRMRHPLLKFLRGGEGGIRTLEGLLTLTPLAGARLRPLGHLSGLDLSGPSRSAG
jgi:hypothetical protein